MELKDIAAISGKPGLYRIIKPTRTGVIVEPLGQSKGRTVVSASYRISILQEVSIYTNDEEGTVALADVYYTMHEQFGAELPVTSKSSKNELTAFVEQMIPDYDTEKVYHSDMKKLISWYNALLKHAPETLVRKEEEETKEEVSEEKEA